VLRSIALIVVLIIVIIFTVRNTRPVFATRGTIGEELRKRAPEAAAVLAPTDSAPIERFMATEKFRAEQRNFFEDIMRTKQVDSARADSIASFAVREAYVRGISPAIIFGVMLTENARFISSAMSNVGAVGLMQVYPKVWLKKEFTDSLGKDLASDSTNVRFGVFILSQYFNPRTKAGGTRTRDYRTALLRYNGCVTGSNTPHCKNYPDKVKQYVEASAKSICDGRGFYECIAKPFMDGLFGEAPATPAK
jgi:soluble lytic murein transglycosylase-like protein